MIQMRLAIELMTPAMRKNRAGGLVGLEELDFNKSRGWVSYINPTYRRFAMALRIRSLALGKRSCWVSGRWQGKLGCFRNEAESRTAMNKACQILQTT